MFDYMTSSDLLSTDSRSMYVCYMLVTRLVLKHNAFVLPLLKELGVKGAATQNLDVTHVDDATVYSATKEHVNLMVSAGFCYAKNPTKPSSFHSVSFKKPAHLFLEEL